MKKKSLEYFLLYFVLFFPFLKPDYASLFPKVSLIFNVWKLISIILSIIIIVKKKRISKPILLVILLNSVLLISTIINNGNIMNNLLFSSSMISLAILFEIGMENKKIFFQSLMFSFEILIYLNFISIILNPNGLYVTGNALTGIAHENWILGFKNTHISHFLPAFIIAFINLKNYNKKFQSYLLMTIIMISSIICKSTTTIIGLSLLAAIAFLPKLKKHYKIFNLRNYLLVFILIFFFIVVFRREDIFSFFIDQILNKSFTFSRRVELWDITIDYIKLKPIIGYGMQSYDLRHSMYNSATIVHAHNQLLENLFVGGFVYLFIYILIFVNINKESHNYRDNVIIQIGSAGIFVWLILGLAEAYINPIMYLVIIIMMYAPRFIETEEGESK